AGEARVLDTLGVLWDRRGDHAKAALIIARAMAIKDEEGDREGRAISLGNLGRIALHDHRIEDAEEFLGLDLQLARKLGDRRGEAIVHTNLSECQLALHRLQGALEHGEEALRVSRAIGDQVSEGFALIALANAHNALKEYPLALEQVTEAEDLFNKA